MKSAVSRGKVLSNLALLLALSSALSAAVVACYEPVAQEADGIDQSTQGLGADRAQPALELRLHRALRDPGVRGGPPGAGGPIAGLTENELALWKEGRFRSTEVEGTCDTCSDYPQGTPLPPDAPADATNSAGLGARFNANTCTTGCHSQPALGGTSPAINPSFALAKAKGATNLVPFFETLDGPTREVRFLFNPDGSRDGGVHQKFTVAGRSDAPGCSLAQPNFEAERGNLAFRIPSPMFGLGLIDALQDSEILAHKNANLARKAELGIHGITNNSPNDGTISKFGWKAQNKSIALFAGEAYNVEMGITNELNPTSKTEDDACNLGAEPNDVTRTGEHGGEDAFDDPLKQISDWMVFSVFMRFTDQPKPAPFDASAERGLEAFKDVGCAECHTPSMRTKDGERGPASPALRGQTANLFSDLLVHHMGSRLADNVIQGNAQRLFFLHDGRAKSLVEAIVAHYSAPSAAHGSTPAYPASEANTVIENFVNLPVRTQQDVVNFLRSL
jgi:Di-haem oxidoreductase, putative peroxidase